MSFGRWAFWSFLKASIRRFCLIVAIELSHIFDPFAVDGIVLAELVGLDDAERCIDDALHESQVLDGKFAQSDVHHVDRVWNGLDVPRLALGQASVHQGLAIDGVKTW